MIVLLIASLVLPERPFAEPARFESQWLREQKARQFRLLRPSPRTADGLDHCTSTKADKQTQNMQIGKVVSNSLVLNDSRVPLRRSASSQFSRSANRRWLYAWLPQPRRRAMPRAQINSRPAARTRFLFQNCKNHITCNKINRLGRGGGRIVPDNRRCPVWFAPFRIGLKTETNRSSGSDVPRRGSLATL